MGGYRWESFVLFFFRTVYLDFYQSQRCRNVYYLTLLSWRESRTFGKLTNFNLVSCSWYVQSPQQPATMKRHTTHSNLLTELNGLKSMLLPIGYKTILMPHLFGLATINEYLDVSNCYPHWSVRFACIAYCSRGASWATCQLVFRLSVFIRCLFDWIAHYALWLQILDEKSLIKKYQKEITSLKTELEQLRRGIMGQPYAAKENSEDLAHLRKQVLNCICNQISADWLPKRSGNEDLQFYILSN